MPRRDLASGHDFDGAPAMVIAAWTAAAISAVTAVEAVRRIVADRRRVTNGLWLIAVLLCVWVTAILVLEAAGRSSAAIVLAFGPMLLGVIGLVGVGVGLLANSLVVIRREGLSLATLVPAAMGLALLAEVFLGAHLLHALTEGISAVTAVLLVALLIPGALVVLQLAAYTVYAVVHRRLPGGRDAGVVVVLGSGLNGERLTPLLRSRMDLGISEFRRLVDDGGDPFLVCSGGRGHDEVIAEGEAMARYALAQGIPSNRLLREVRSTTTEENLRYSAELLASEGIAWTRMLVTTSSFHALRAGSLTRRLGLPATALGAPTALYFRPAAFLREFVAVVVHYRRANLIVCAVLVGMWGLLVAVVMIVADQAEPVILDGAALEVLAPRVKGVETD
ncbi:YdcF family protein [Tsukamurella paurometabola]|uniref:YdcF family protein n=1 Tax=Tsukamurella paurometabola TaxID=2061 RepID=UPI00135B7D1F|nr:YdcF family protein [Tsukamurella paurometabola]